MKPTDNKGPRIGIDNVVRLCDKKTFVPQIQLEVKILLDVAAYIQFPRTLKKQFSIAED